MSKLYYLLALIATPLLLSPTAQSDTNLYKKAIADQTRLTEHKIRDSHRLPHAILSLTELGTGDTVIDLAVGSGYYAALFSRVVGPTGKVFAVDPLLIFEHFPQAKDTFKRILKQDPMTNVVYSVQRMDALTVPKKADVVMMALYYHDTLWTGEDRQKMNQAIYAALKPGGKFIVLDHHALPGSDAKVGQSLHRMDAALVVPEVSAAGFKLVQESSVLRNRADPRNVSVFDKTWRGNTDRFIYVFEKPKK